MTVLTEKFLSRIESLGDNCELGFVMRSLNYEKGGLFRWSITRVEKLIPFLEDPYQKIYQESDLEPFSPGMVIDKRTGISFHSKMRSVKNSEGILCYSVDEIKRSEIYEKEKSKIEYLRQGFIDRLRGEKGSIYFVKANKGIANKDIRRIVSILKEYSHKHVLIEVRCNATTKSTNTLNDRGSYFTADVSRFAPYANASDVIYDDWYSLLAAAAVHEDIVE